MSETVTLEGLGKGSLARIVMSKLRPDVDLLEGIKEIGARENVQLGVILSAIGVLKKATFRNLKVFPSNLKIDDSHRLYLDFEQPLELVSLTGWIAAKEGGGHEVHAHLSVSTVIENSIVTLGGHLIPGAITAIKTVIGIGVIEGTDIRAEIDERFNQFDLKLPSLGKEA